MPGWLPLVVLLLPLATALVVGRMRSASFAHGAAAAAMAVATALAAWMLLVALSAAEPFAGPRATWLDVGSFTLGLGVYVDPIGAVMALIVCLLGALVLVFNAWYMHDDPLAARFPWQFCGFLFAMLGVVLSDNLFQTFCCWELVGLGSYLLIGFWWHKPAASEDPEYQALKGANARGVLEHRLSPSHAQLKAFVMNRVGDAGFLLGIGALLALALNVGRGGDVFTWSSLLETARVASDPLLGKGDPGLNRFLILAGALGIFCGAVGKSAQFPLHGWLPDAMQGPTTASSIIHAATMVAAGVFLVARCYALFPIEALDVVAWTGGITCLLAASIACVQWDLKAVLAYSTISQLGLMFVGLGAGDRAAGIAHLFTHAGFKCLLFLCAGAVIHAAAGCQDLQRLGGLRKKMPVTAWCSLAAVLAIGGAPFFSGFYSKDAVIAAALYRATNPTASGAFVAVGPAVLAGLGSLLTSAYMLRWWLRVFAGEPRDAHVADHAHDPSGGAKLVLLALAPLTLALPWTAVGWLDAALRGAEWQQRLALSRGLGEELERAHHAATWLSLGLLAAGGAFATLVFWWAPRRGRDAANALAASARPLHTAASELWGIERLYDLVFTRGIGRGLALLTARLDLGSPQRLAGLDSPVDAPKPAGRREVGSLDELVDGVGRACARAGRGGALVHGGRLGVYLACASIAGAAVLLWGLLA